MGAEPGRACDGVEGSPVTVAAARLPGWEGDVHDGFGCVRVYGEQTPIEHI
jgi:hypothetical protein